MGAIGHSAPMTGVFLRTLDSVMSLLPVVIKAAKKAVPWPDGQPTLPTQPGWKVSATGPGAWVSRP